MEATIVYGFSRTIKHEEKLPVEEAFRMIPKLYGYAFINIYAECGDYGECLVYTTQGLAGYSFICPKCPYPNAEKTLTRKQYNAVYNTRG